MPTDEWERGYSAGYRAAHRTDVRDITSDRGESAPKRRRTRGKDPKLSKAMKEAHKKAKTKNGKFRKGWDQSRMLKYAHKIKGRM
jgi:hypothetical protein